MWWRTHSTESISLLHIGQTHCGSSSSVVAAAGPGGALAALSGVGSCAVFGPACCCPRACGASVDGGGGSPVSGGSFTLFTPLLVPGASRPLCLIEFIWTGSHHLLAAAWSKLSREVAVRFRCGRPE